MNKNEALAHFNDNYVKPIGQKQLMATETYFQSQLDALANDFLNSFHAIGRQVHALQEKGLKGPIGYLHYSWLRTRLLDQDYQLLIETYDSNWYLDNRECLQEYNATWLWGFWAEFARELESKRKPYLDQITPADLELIIRKEVPKYGQYLVSLARYALNRDETLTEFDREAEFEVRVGEYKDLSEIVWKIDIRPKEAAEIKRWLSEKTDLDYCYQVLCGLDLSRGDYEGLDLHYCDLRECDLSDCNLQNATLLGTKLADSRLDRSNFQGALLHEADFHNCSLTGADFTSAEGPSGMLPGPEWQAPGFRGVNFQGADLTGATFSDAILPGADFRGAFLTETDFSGAELQEALFADTAREQVRLTQRQRDQIRWE